MLRASTTYYLCFQFHNLLQSRKVHVFVLPEYFQRRGGRNAPMPYALLMARPIE